MKIKKAFYPEVDISELEYGTMNSCSWERMKPFFEQAAGLKPNEKLVGVTVSEDGFKLKIETKQNAALLKPHPLTILEYKEAVTENNIVKKADMEKIWDFKPEIG